MTVQNYSTAPTNDIGPFASWGIPKKLASIDPWGHKVTEVFGEYYDKVIICK